jgi:tetratricopeptide (TPR) repeat protein
MRSRSPARALAIAGLAGVTLALQAPESHAGDDARALAHADSLYGAQAWPQAVAAYADVVPGRPQDGLHWYRYGTSLLQAGRAAEAIPALQHSESIGHNPRVMYNLACALVREHRNDEALDWLLAATAAGFDRPKLLETDADLAPLRSRARWGDVVAAAERNARPCAFDDRHRQLDFWIGDWDVVTAGDQPAGESHVEAILGTCVIFENWTGLQGMSGKSFNFIDPATDRWKQTWVNDKGGVQEYVGEFTGDAMCYRRETQDGSGPTLWKMTLFDLEPGHVRQLGESSTDGGTTWTTQYDLHYHRKP